MSDTKAFNVRLPRHIWVFLRNQSTERDKSLNSLILELIEKDKKRLEKKLEKKLTQE